MNTSLTVLLRWEKYPTEFGVNLRGQVTGFLKLATQSRRSEDSEPAKPKTPAKLSDLEPLL
jgi:hypothetical protein